MAEDALILGSLVQCSYKTIDTLPVIYCYQNKLKYWVNPKRNPKSAINQSSKLWNCGSPQPDSSTTLPEVREIAKIGNQRLQLGAQTAPQLSPDFTDTPRDRHFVAKPRKISSRDLRRGSSSLVSKRLRSIWNILHSELYAYLYKFHALIVLWPLLVAYVLQVIGDGRGARRPLPVITERTTNMAFSSIRLGFQCTTPRFQGFSE